MVVYSRLSKWKKIRLRITVFNQVTLVVRQRIRQQTDRPTLLPQFSLKVDRVRDGRPVDQPRPWDTNNPSHIPSGRKQCRCSNSLSLKSSPRPSDRPSSPVQSSSSFYWLSRISCVVFPSAFVLRLSRPPSSKWNSGLPIRFFFSFSVDDDDDKRVYGYLFYSLLFLLPVARSKSLNKYLPM